MYNSDNLNIDVNGLNEKIEKLKADFDKLVIDLRNEMIVLKSDFYKIIANAIEKIAINQSRGMAWLIEPGGLVS